MKVEKQVCIIITTYKDRKITPICVNSILKINNYKNCKILIADNSPTKEYYECLNSKFKKYKDVGIMWQKKNVYCSGNYNLGIKYCFDNYNPDIIVILNNDTRFTDANLLNKIVKTFKKYGDVGIIMVKLISPNKNYAPYGNKINEVAIKHGEITGSAMFIKKEVFDRVGIFDEYFQQSFEDVDLDIRAVKAGFKILYYGKTSLNHVLGYTLQPKSGIKIPDYEKPHWYINLINIGYLIRKHFTSTEILEMGKITIYPAFVSVKNIPEKRKLMYKALKEGLSRKPISNEDTWDFHYEDWKTTHTW